MFVLSSTFVPQCDRTSKIHNRPCWHVYRPGNWTPLQLFVSITVLSLSRWAKLILLFGLCQLLSASPSVFFLFHLSTPSVCSFWSSSSILPLLLHGWEWCSFHYCQLPLRATSWPGLLPSSISLWQFTVRQLQGVPCTEDLQGLLLFMIIDGTPGHFKNTTKQLKNYFCVSSLC